VSPEALAELVSRLAGIRADEAPPPAEARRAVRDVVVVGSSSRGGSSIFAEILRRSPALVHLRAEINPFLVMHGLGYPLSQTGSDALGPRPEAELDAVGEALAWDLGGPCDRLADEQDRRRFARDLAARLSLQWTGERFEVAELYAHVAALTAEGAGVAGGRLVDLDAFHARLLARLRDDHPSINPYYYDLPPAVVRAACPGAPPAEGPPGEFLVEEPPFVCIRPWRRVSLEELESRPVVVKTPSNAYRLPFLRQLFPDARLRLLHLTRNVAASVNGLYDGWRYPGFYAHRLPVVLSIGGYSDLAGGYGERWWKFDLPPGWREMVTAPLEEVCAFQWRSAHAALLAEAPPDVLRLRFEDVVGAVDARASVARALGDWLGTGDDPPLRQALERGLPPVMATSAPRRQRWFSRALQLGPVLLDARNQKLMKELGYAPDPATWT